MNFSFSNSNFTFPESLKESEQKPRSDTLLGFDLLYSFLLAHSSDIVAFVLKNKLSPTIFKFIITYFYKKTSFEILKIVMIYYCGNKFCFIYCKKQIKGVFCYGTVKNRY